MRTAIPSNTPFIAAKATGLRTSSNRQTVFLSNGNGISARLVVLSHGLSVALKDQVGIERIVTSPCHSITVAFDIKPRRVRTFDFAALTYYPEHTADRTAYLTLFPIRASMRANMMVYRNMDDPWLRAMRQDPENTLFALMPNLRRLTGEIEIVGPIKIRPADLYVSKGHRQAGVVLVGDAFATSCPAAGTGTGKVFNDVERLCNIHIPRWLATKGMGAEKIAEFYDDPVKRSYDDASAAFAYQLRSLSIDKGVRWALQRNLRFIVRGTIGTARRLGMIDIAGQVASEHLMERLRSLANRA
jgi:2-polyprenyl-6-methoxyphenol hydroxylase-like FAD-dependent oxidoreductase